MIFAKGLIFKLFIFIVCSFKEDFKVIKTPNFENGIKC